MIFPLSFHRFMYFYEPESPDNLLLHVDLVEVIPDCPHLFLRALV